MSLISLGEDDVENLAFAEEEWEEEEEKDRAISNFWRFGSQDDFSIYGRNFETGQSFRNFGREIFGLPDALKEGFGTDSFLQISLQFR